MLLSSVYLYANKVDVYVNPIVETGSITRYNKVYNRNLKVYRSTDNRIDIRVRNSSQKLANLGDTALVFRIIASDTQRLAFEKDCTIKDPDGIAFVDLTRRDMERLQEGQYYYTITQEFREQLTDGYRVTRSVVLYNDSQFGARTGLLVFGDVKGSFQPSILIDNFMITNPIFLSEPEPRFRVSSIIDANPWTTTPQTLHTFQFYFSDTYQGQVLIEANLDLQGASPAATEDGWFTVLEFEKTKNVEYHNVVGKFSWFRIKHFPEVETTLDPVIQNELGTLDKVLYR
jgi:hypothetical protein